MSSYYHSIAYMPWNLETNSDGLIEWSGQYIDTYHTFKMVPQTRPSIASPKVNTQVMSNDLLDGGIDISRVKYEFGTRSGDWDFYVLNELSNEFNHYLDWNTRFEQLFSNFNGRKGLIVLLDDPFHCYYGRITFKNWKSEKDYSKVTLHYEVSAGRYTFANSQGKGMPEPTFDTHTFNTYEDALEYAMGLDSFVDIIQNDDGTWSVLTISQSFLDDLGENFPALKPHDPTDPENGFSANIFKVLANDWDWDELFAKNAEFGSIKLPSSGHVWKEYINDEIGEEETTIYFAGSSSFTVYIFSEYSYTPDLSAAEQTITFSGVQVEATIPNRTVKYLYFVGAAGISITVSHKGGVVL